MYSVCKTIIQIQRRDKEGREGREGRRGRIELGEGRDRKKERGRREEGSKKRRRGRERRVGRILYIIVQVDSILNVCMVYMQFAFTGMR